jgi:phosphate transport system substrate-binding protein
LSATYLKTNFSVAKKCVFTLVALLAGAAVFLTACSGGQHIKNAVSGAGGKTLTVQGSDTMDKMVRAWSEAYKKVHPDVSIDVQSGDTGSGIKYLIDGKISVAAASRELTAGEDSQAHAKGVHLSRTMVAKDAVAVIVGAKNPVSELTMDELKGIFAGDITKWSQIKSNAAAQDQSAIVVLGREASSGTGDFLREHILGGKPFGADVKLMLSSEAVIDAVVKQKEAIGFVGISQADRAGPTVKVLTIRLNASSPMDLKEDSLTGSDYPLSRPLYLYCDASSGDLTKSFVAFCQSADGQKIAQDMGFIKLH